MSPLQTSGFVPDPGIAYLTLITFGRKLVSQHPWGRHHRNGREEEWMSMTAKSTDQLLRTLAYDYSRSIRSARRQTTPFLFWITFHATRHRGLVMLCITRMRTSTVCTSLILLTCNPEAARLGIMLKLCTCRTRSYLSTSSVTIRKKGMWDGNLALGPGPIGQLRLEQAISLNKQMANLLFWRWSSTSCTPAAPTRTVPFAPYSGLPPSTPYVGRWSIAYSPPSITQ